MRIYRSLVLFSLALLASVPTYGHEIPADITAHVLVKADNQRLRVLVRVPLRVIRDVTFPTEGPAYLQISRAERLLADGVMLWIAPNLAAREEGALIDGQQLVRTRLSLPSDRSFASFDEAMAHVQGPALPETERLPWDAALLDALFEYPIQSERSRFSVRLDFRRLASRVTTAIRFLRPDGAVRAFEYVRDPGWIDLDPRWHQAFLTFVELGLVHILDGIDHLLFLLCLVVPVRRVRSLVLIVTAFTVAHSLTLVGSAFGLAPEGLWFPPLVETLIATSIVYMALENIVFESQRRDGQALSGMAAAALRRRWILAFAFGLVHGFGFSFALRDSLQFAGSHLLTSLLSFNIGVELGQLLVLGALVPALAFFFRFLVAERIGAIVISALIAHTSWHWMTERWRVLQAYSWPAVDAAVIVSTLWWTTAVLAIGIGARLLFLRSAQGKADVTPRRLP